MIIKYYSEPFVIVVCCCSCPLLCIVKEGNEGDFYEIIYIIIINISMENAFCLFEKKRSKLCT